MKTNIALILIFLLIGLAGCPASAGPLVKLTAVKIDWRSSYDDNILRYSGRDIDRFKYSAESYLSKLSTFDDWKNEFTLKIYLDGPQILKYRSDIWYFGKFAGYYRNPFNNYSTHTLILKQKLHDRIEIHFKYFYMPDFYLREYRDRDTGEPEKCSFDDHQVRLGVTVEPIKNLNVTVQAEFEQLYYNEYFTEYDSESWLYELELEKRFGRNFWLVLNYGYKLSDNIGSVSVQTTPMNIDPQFLEDSEYGDSSYEADIYMIELRRRFRQGLLSDDFWVKMQYKLRRRFYTTDNSLILDPYHAGRQDDRTRWIFSVTQDIGSLWEIGLEYTYEYRDTESYYKTVVDAKDFSQNIITLNLTRRIY